MPLLEKEKKKYKIAADRIFSILRPFSVSGSLDFPLFCLFLNSFKSPRAFGKCEEPFSYISMGENQCRKFGEYIPMNKLWHILLFSHKHVYVQSAGE